MFVLLGNFQSFACSSASTDYASVKDNFAALAALLASFPRIMVRHLAPQQPMAPCCSVARLCMEELYWRITTETTEC
jgi:hypothetical protein